MRYDPAEFSAKLSCARQRGKEALQELAEDHLPLVAAMVHRFPPCHHEREELYQQGCIGLMKALARFDPAYNTAFSTYAVAMILGEMRALCRLDTPLHIPRGDRTLHRHIRHAQEQLHAILGREPTMQEIASTLRMNATELVFAMDQVRVSSGDTPSGHTLIELLPDQDDWMNRLLLRDIITRLPREDQRLLLLRFRMGTTQSETARALGMTQVQVSRRESALKKQIRLAWLDAE